MKNKTKVTKEQIISCRAKFSPDFIAANPDLFPPEVRGASNPKEIVAPDGKQKKIRKSPEPKTQPEIQMEHMLKRWQEDGEATRYGFELVTLVVGSGFRYTGDWVYWDRAGRMHILETKGGFIRRSGLQAFQAAKMAYPEIDFQLWQLVKREWRKLS